MDPSDAAALEWDWGFWGRPKQLAVLSGDYKWEILQCGRGFGKTRTGAEWVRHRCENDATQRLLIVGPTFSFVRDEMIEGDGILSICPPHNYPTFAESRLILTWPNGAMARGFGADNPNRIRGKNLTGAWLDEYCAWRPNRRKKSLTQIRFCLRKGDPRILMTTTPQPDQDYEDLVEQAEKEPDKYRITYGNSFENQANLSSDFESMISDLIGTTEGEQEVDGRLIRNVAGALFRREWMQLWREKTPPEITEQVLSVDPAESNSAGADNVGIVKFGIDAKRNGYVIADLTAKMTIDAGLRLVCLACQECSKILVDTQGGSTWVTSLRLFAQSKEMCEIFGPGGCPLPEIVELTSGPQSKPSRAVTAQSLYQSGRIFHLGYFVGLVKTLTRWVPGSSRYSPGDFDALVQAINHFFVVKPKVRISFGGHR